MTNYIYTFLFIFIILHFSLAQDSWTKYESNPVLVWDAGALQVDAVLHNNGTYHMWYTAFDFNPPANVGYSTSPDGKNWTKYENNPVFSEGYSVSVVLVDSVYHMWYGTDGNEIGYAASANGINWNIHPDNPVLTPGAEGSWDEYGVQQPSVLFDQDRFHMWYHSPNSSGGFKIGYATSEDGVNWAKYENPVLLMGESGEWDDSRIISPNVIKKDSVYYLFYQGKSAISQFGYATSNDGKNWTKSDRNPVLTTSEEGSWDESGLASPALLFDGEIFHLWYAGIDNDNNWQIGYASAPVITAIYNNPYKQPEIFVLGQNYPNPFNPITTINYQLAMSSDVDLSIYNLLGQKVATLVDKKQTAGSYQLKWNASGFSSGIYIYTLEISSGFKQSRKMLLIK